MSSGEIQNMDLSKALEGLGKRLFSDICRWALLGWKYAAYIDQKFLFDEPVHKFKKSVSEFIDPSNPPDTSKKTSTKNSTQACIQTYYLDGSTDSDAMVDRATAVLDALLAESDLSARWTLLSNYMHSNVNALLQDDCVTHQGDGLPELVAKETSEDALNVLIIGAGPSGLATANRFKLRLKARVNVIVIEKRAMSFHQKKIYDRNWPLHVNSQIIDGVLDPRLETILKEFGAGGYVGATLATLETLLFWSNRAQGVKFFFGDDYSLDFLEKSSVDLVVDATGGRLDYHAPGIDSVSKNTKMQEIQVPLASSEGFEAGYAKFGITHAAHDHAKFIKFESSDYLAYPKIDDVKIQSAMFKLTQIPISLYQPLLDFVKPQNSDSLFYVWPNSLHEDINKLLVLINLDPAGFKEMRLKCDRIQPLSELLTVLCQSSTSAIDKRILDMFDYLAHFGVEAQTIVEPPFLYSPYVRTDLAHVRRCYGKPMFAVGDSLFNGHPKVGNGLAGHLVLSKIIADSIVDYYVEKTG